MTGHERVGTSHTEALLAEYAEVNENFRLLTDIRFKLLAFLPLIAAGGLAAAGVGSSQGAPPGLEAGIFLFGLVVTGALASYNARNDQIYVRLVVRAGEIERELGLTEGSFARRPNAWLEISLGFWPWHVGHVSSVSAVYGSAMVIWLTGLVAAVAQLAWGAGEMPWWIYALAVAVAATVVPVAAIAMRRQRESREAEILAIADEAVELAPRFRTARSKSQCRDAPDYKRFMELCADLLGREHHRDWAKSEVARRIGYYAELPSFRRRRFGFEGGDQADLNYVATLVDLPPGMLVPAPRRR